MRTTANRFGWTFVDATLAADKMQQVVLTAELYGLREHAQFVRERCGGGWAKRMCHWKKGTLHTSASSLRGNADGILDMHV